MPKLHRQSASDLALPEKASRSPLDEAGGSTLSARVTRWKMLWLDSVMGDARLNSTQKCIAYAIASHLNCVTLDCWPSHERLADRLNIKSSKTIQRGLLVLESYSIIAIIRPRGKHASCRYAPIFGPVDKDKPVLKRGHLRSSDKDANVHQSYLEIPGESFSTGCQEGHAGALPRISPPPYPAAERGRLEIRLASLLGANGMDVLATLSAISDSSVDRLCRALHHNELTEREVEAARLAAWQAR